MLEPKIMARIDVKGTEITIDATGEVTFRRGGQVVAMVPPLIGFDPPYAHETVVINAAELDLTPGTPIYELVGRTGKVVVDYHGRVVVHHGDLCTVVFPTSPAVVLYQVWAQGLEASDLIEIHKLTFYCAAEAEIYCATAKQNDRYHGEDFSFHDDYPAALAEAHSLASDYSTINEVRIEHCWPEGQLPPATLVCRVNKKTKQYEVAEVAATMRTPVTDFESWIEQKLQRRDEAEQAEPELDFKPYDLSASE